MAHKSLLVAEHILWLRREWSTTPLALNKLTFLAHGWTLGDSGDPLIRETAQAWKHGPVYVPVYKRFKKHKANSIPAIDAVSHKADLSDYHASMINTVHEAYKTFSPGQLVSITHKKGSPWKQARDKWGPGSPISDESIRLYYEKRVKKIERQRSI